MNGSDQLAADREAFRSHCDASGRNVSGGDAEAANAHTAAADAIVERWTASGQIRELLSPLLDDPSPEVRLAAAAHLLRGGDAELALPVLEALDRNRDGSAGLTARLLVRRWRAQHQTSQ